MYIVRENVLFKGIKGVDWGKFHTKDVAVKYSYKHTKGTIHNIYLLFKSYWEVEMSLCYMLYVIFMFYAFIF